MCVAEHVNSRLHPSIKGAHTCVSQNKAIQRCCTHTGMCKQVWLGFADQACCENTHVCCSIRQMQVASKDQGFQLQGVGRPRAAATVHTRLAEIVTRINDKFEVAPKDHKRRGVWPTRDCCKLTHMCVRNNQFQVAPKDHRLHATGRRICQVRVAPESQGLQVFGRPRAAASIHMCVAK